MTGKGGRPCVFLCHPCACEDPASLSFAVVLAPPGGAVPRSRPFHFRGEDCLSAALVLLVLLVLSVAEGSVAEGSVAKELSISDRLPTKNRFFTAFRMTTFGFSGGPRPGATGFGSFCRNKRVSSCGADTPQEKRKEGRAPRPAPTHRHHEPVGDDLQPALSGAEGCRLASFQITPPPKPWIPDRGRG